MRYTPLKNLSPLDPIRLSEGTLCVVAEKPEYKGGVWECGVVVSRTNDTWSAGDWLQLTEDDSTPPSITLLEKLP